MVKESSISLIRLDSSIKEGRSSKDNLQVMTSLQGMSDEFRSIVIDLWSLNCKHRQLTFFLPDSEDIENA